MSKANMEEVIGKLEKVLSGDLTREEISEWAELKKQRGSYESKGHDC
ncbi:hypothetical protein [Pontibacillus salipaludis]|uniref:Uncharacterized protein n=1 Tax=Pontibacillus salipaludis TaxID=1697394 RepID=A0ABQ1Q021_9BACI|nr:hypothetical protein [Pontibacillus salipaludis]GGD08432.1 hypothetical protein GCM10011389_15020 [Pontibacillus salipaludis]